MSRIIDERVLFNEVNLAVEKSVIMDMSEIDFLSVAINITACTGSNVLDLLESLDGINFVPVASKIMTEPSLTIWHVYPVFSRYKKLHYVPGTGGATFTVQINARDTGIQSSGKTPDITPGVN
jgi:hypothetical protein